MTCETIYLRPDDKDVRLETYVSKKSGDMWWTPPRPCMLILPGGAYYFLAEREAEPAAKAFLAEGFNCFVLYYSLGEKAEFPRPLQDVSLAIAHIKRHAAEYNVDPERIFVCGFSAGGHLAASTGVFWNDKEAAFEGMEPGENKPAGMVLCYGVLSLCEHTHIESCRYVTGREEPTEAQCARWSPDKHIGKDTVPAFLWHTQRDVTVDVRCSLSMANALILGGVPSEIHIYPEGPHGLSVATEETGDVDPHIAHWIRDCVEWTKLVPTLGEDGK